MCEVSMSGRSWRSLLLGLTRLSEQGITDTLLEREWAAIQQTDQDEAEYCRAAARLGLDPYSDAEPYEQDIIDAAESLSGNLLSDFLDAVSPAYIGKALKWITSMQATVEGRETGRGPRAFERYAGADVEVIQDLRARVPLSAFRSHRRPWDVGYEQARMVRSQIAPDSQARFAVDRYVNARIRKAPDLNLQALGTSTEHARSVVVIGQDRPATSNRFTLSRALWHRIWDDSPLFVVTTAHTSRQQIERAFAAELLAPAEGIAQLLESPPEAASQEELEQIAQRYGVSSMVIEHQLRNHLIASQAA